jgi:hypothetical protein
MAVPRPEPPTFISLDDQQPLTDEELTIAHRCRLWAVGEVERRYAYLLDNDLPPELWMPQAGWNCSRLIYEGFRTLGRGEHLSYLRLYARQFTGYALYALGNAGRRPIPSDNDLATLDEQLRSRGARGDPCISRYARLAEQLPRHLHVSAPRKFGEVGWLVGQHLVNPDVVAYLERLALLHRGGLLDRLAQQSRARRAPLTVLEIGAGYGGLAYFLSGVLPPARYLIVDIPESLLYSSIYLSVLRPDLRHGYGVEQIGLPGPGFTFISNYEFPRLLATTPPVIDLAINTLSMSEMTADQVATYSRGIAQVLTRDGLFFEQNQDNRPLGMLNAADIVGESFSSCRPLGDSIGSESVEQGAAHVWTL